MPASKCPKCQTTQFELVRQDHIGNHPMYFVQCKQCNTVVGVTEFYDTATLLNKIARKWGINDLLTY
jgi:predicted nucleic-acid-binding Zn-ribbon protein